MNRTISLCLFGALTAALGACATPGAEKQQTDIKAQAATQVAKDQNCDEVTGTRIRRCASDTAGRSITSGPLAPDAPFTPPMPGPAGR